MAVLRMSSPRVVPTRRARTRSTKGARRDRMPGADRRGRAGAAVGTTRSSGRAGGLRGTGRAVVRADGREVATRGVEVRGVEVREVDARGVEVRGVEAAPGGGAAGRAEARPVTLRSEWVRRRAGERTRPAGWRPPRPRWAPRRRG